MNPLDCVQRERERAHAKGGACLLRGNNFLLRLRFGEGHREPGQRTLSSSVRLSQTGIQELQLQLLALSPTG